MHFVNINSKMSWAREMQFSSIWKWSNCKICLWAMDPRPSMGVAYCITKSQTEFTMPATVQCSPQTQQTAPLPRSNWPFCSIRPIPLFINNPWLYLHTYIHTDRFELIYRPPLRLCLVTTPTYFAIIAIKTKSSLLT